LTAFAGIIKNSCLEKDDYSTFKNLLSQTAAQVRNFRIDTLKDENFWVVKYWFGHSRTQGFAKDPATGSWLCCVGNPTDAKVNDWPQKDFSDKLLNAYLKNGCNEITSLSAPFVVIIYDGRDASFNIITDRIGIQHIYLARHEGAFLFCTSALALASVIPVTLDKTSVVNYFNIGHLLGNRTFFKEIKKVDGAIWMKISDGLVRTDKYWHTPFESEKESDISEYAGDLRKKLIKAVSSRIDSDNRTSIELTGGLDSRVNLACAKLSGKEFHTWTIGEENCPEINVVKELKQKDDFNSHYISVEKSLEENFLDDLIKINILNDGERDSLGLIASLASNRISRDLRESSISGIGGEILRGFYYISHKGVLNSSKKIRTSRLVNLKLRPNINPSKEIFNEDIMGSQNDILRGSVEDYFVENDDGGIFWRLDDFYLKARQQRFAGRSCCFNNYFYRQQLPYFDNEVLDRSFTIPWRYKKGSRVLKHVLEMTHPGYSGIKLVNGSPARPYVNKDLFDVIKFEIGHARTVLEKFGIFCKNGKTNSLRGNSISLENVIRKCLSSKEILDIFNYPTMWSNFLYKSDEFRNFVKKNVENGFPDRVQIGLILSFELTCRYVGGIKI